MALDKENGFADFHQIFENLSVITFKADRVYLPKRRIVLVDAPLENDPLSQDAIELKMYAPNNKRKKLSNKDAKTYVSSLDANCVLRPPIRLEKRDFKKS